MSTGQLERSTRQLEWWTRWLAQLPHRLVLATRRRALFVFASKRGNRLKVLWFDDNGYCLLYKRLHQALFEVPVADAADRPLASIDACTLAMILRGVAR